MFETVRQAQLGDEDDDDRSGGSPLAGFLGKVAMVVFIAVPLLPSIIVAGLVHKMLSRLRLRAHVIFGILLVSNLIAYSIWKSFDLWQMLKDAFASFSDFQENWASFIGPFAILCFMLGSLIGFVFVLWSAHNVRTTPHLRQDKGSWTYRFEYRRTPIEWLKKRKNIKKLKSGDLVAKNRSPMGIEENREDRPVHRYYTEANRHTLITGAAGAGKTFSMMAMILNDIINGKSCIIIDFKRDPELASKAAYWANEYGRPFYHFVNGDPEKYDIAANTKGQTRYDPLKGGTPTSKADMVLGMREYDVNAAVHKSNMQQLLQVLFAALKHADRSKTENIRWSEGGINQIASVLEDDNLIELLEACEDTPAHKNVEAVYNASKSKSSALKSAIDQLQGQMRTMMASEYGEWLKLDEDETDIELYDMTKNDDNPPVILFSLNSDSEPDFAKYMGSLILTDITSMSARRRNEGLKNQVMVYVDEFQAVNPDSVTALLEKSRASKVAMTLSLQSFEQIIKASESNGEAYLSSVLDTCSNFIIHAGATDPSAEKLSGIQGKDNFPVYKFAQKNENFFLNWNFFNRRNQIVNNDTEYDWITQPKEFMNLEIPTASNKYKSTAMVLNKSVEDPAHRKHVGAIARKTWMIPPEAVFVEHYKGRGLEPEDAVVKPVEIENDFDEDKDLIEGETSEDSEVVEQDADQDSSTDVDEDEYDYDHAPLIEPDEEANEEPDDEGDFDFEEVSEDDEDEDDFFSIDALSNNASSTSKKKNSKSKQSVDPESSGDFNLPEL